MFDSLKNKVSKSSKRSARQSSVEIPRTVEFLRALVNHNTRLTYSALADAAAMLGEHTPTGLSAGQRGARLLGGIPVDLQPHICRANGAYKKGQEWEAETPSDLRKRDYVRPENVSDFVTAFIEATDGATLDDEDIDPETGEPLEG